METAASILKDISSIPPSIHKVRVFENGRGIGVTDALHGFAEWPVIVAFALITQLGEGWFLFLLASSYYVAGDDRLRWGVDRRRGLFVLALVLTYVGLIEAIKAFFDLPRPPGAGEPPELLWLPAILTVSFDNFAIATGPGFPSGHALGSTMVWGGLALVIKRGSFRRRVGVASGIILLVSVSRLVLGVHYAVDVVVGIGLGVLVLGILYRLANRGTDPGPVLLVAVGVGVLGLLVGVTIESMATFGGAVGAWLVWLRIEHATPMHPSKQREIIGGFLVLGVMAMLVGLLVVYTLPIWLTVLVAAVAAGGVVGAPVLGERLGGTLSRVLPDTDR